jgi:OmpA-OmpF porin, OOP family
MIRRLITVVTLLLIAGSSFAQSGEIQVSGKVIDARSNRPVRAEVKYSSIPTGSLSGVFNDSTFSFTIFGTASYELTVKAPGYAQRKMLIDPSKRKNTPGISADIILLPKDEPIVLQHLIFLQGKADIEESSYSELDRIAEMMMQNPMMEIQLEGHTDSQGTPDANMKLSQERVEAVKTYLTAKGIHKKRVSTRAFGGTQPVSSESTPDARAKNRRVEMRVIKN